jgi:hypothetical protein
MGDKGKLSEALEPLFSKPQLKKWLLIITNIGKATLKFIDDNSKDPSFPITPETVYNSAFRKFADKRQLFVLKLAIQYDLTSGSMYLPLPIFPPLFPFPLHFIHR